MTEGRIVSAENAEHYKWGTSCDAWHLVKRPDLSVIHERMPPGTRERRHFHTRAHQFFFVLKGTATLEVQGHIHTLGPGQGLEVAATEAHEMGNTSGEDLEFVVVSCPPSHGDRVDAPL